jgi:hypothetical protein
MFSTHRPPANRLTFQQHSRLCALSAFVFLDIPASVAGFPQRPFVFNNIRASFVHFLKLLSLFFLCDKRHPVPRRRAKGLLGPKCQQIARALGDPKNDPTNPPFPVPYSLFPIPCSLPLTPGT